MKHGHRNHLSIGKIDCMQLRKINPEAARRAVLEYLGSNGHSISQRTLVFGINPHGWLPTNESRKRVKSISCQVFGSPKILGSTIIFFTTVMGAAPKGSVVLAESTNVPVPTAPLQILTLRVSFPALSSWNIPPLDMASITV
jgi:hypothetical protein